MNEFLHYYYSKSAIVFMVLPYYKKITSKKLKIFYDVISLSKQMPRSFLLLLLYFLFGPLLITSMML